MGERLRQQIQIVGEHGPIVSGILLAESDAALHEACRRAKFTRLKLQLAEISQACGQCRCIWRGQPLSSPDQVFRENPDARIGPSTIPDRRFHERIVQPVGSPFPDSRKLFGDKPARERFGGIITAVVDQRAYAAGRVDERARVCARAGCAGASAGAEQRGSEDNATAR